MFLTDRELQIKSWFRVQSTCRASRVNTVLLRSWNDEWLSDIQKNITQIRKGFITSSIHDFVINDFSMTNRSDQKVSEFSSVSYVSQRTTITVISSTTSDAISLWNEYAMFEIKWFELIVCSDGVCMMTITVYGSCIAFDLSGSHASKTLYFK